MLHGKDDQVDWNEQNFSQIPETWNFVEEVQQEFRRQEERGFKKKFADESLAFVD